MEKENKKFKNVTTNQTRQAYHVGAQMFIESEAVLNSTAKHPNDLSPSSPTETDLSIISAITSCTTNFDLNNELAMTAANYKVNTNNEVIALSSDIITKQTELDCLYMQYLMVLLTKENLKKSLKEEEDIGMRDIFEIHKANETLKKNCSELEYEEKLIDNLIELVKFIDSFNAWMDQNEHNFNKFQSFYNHFSDICGKTKQYLPIKNIHVPENIDFEETLSSELYKSCCLLEQINKVVEDHTNLNRAPDVEENEKVDYKLLEELSTQYNKLKDCIIKYNGIKTIL